MKVSEITNDLVGKRISCNYMGERIEATIADVKSSLFLREINIQFDDSINGVSSNWVVAHIDQKEDVQSMWVWGIRVIN